MISVAEAQRIIAERARPLLPISLPLGPQLLGCILAESVASDLDLPPFDKALMDGYAVRASDFAGGSAELHVVEEVAAGRTPSAAVGAGQATRIMTGAPIPAGADAVVMVERSRMLDGQRVRLEDVVKPEQNLLRRGREMRLGETVVPPGCALRPQEFGVLAAVGRTHALVHPRPTVAVAPTGDEITEVHEKPGPGQIRNSNGPMLLAQIERAGGVPEFLGLARDTRESLREHILRGLESDVFILSGGVSAGKLDLVPSVLEELGVQSLIQKIAMKPGKPMVFGVKLHAERPPTLVFGLPGNPVSSLVCFELFVRPALRLLRGQTASPEPISAALTEPMRYRTDRATYYPARLECVSAGWRVTPVPWFGSPDLRGVLGCNAFAVIPPGTHDFQTGELLPILRVDGRD